MKELAHVTFYDYGAFKRAILEYTDLKESEIRLTREINSERIFLPEIINNPETNEKMKKALEKIEKTIVDLANYFNIEYKDVWAFSSGIPHRSPGLSLTYVGDKNSTIVKNNATERLEVKIKSSNKEYIGIYALKDGKYYNDDKISLELKSGYETEEEVLENGNYYKAINDMDNKELIYSLTNDKHIFNFSIYSYKIRNKDKFESIIKNLTLPTNVEVFLIKLNDNYIIHDNNIPLHILLYQGDIDAVNEDDFSDYIRINENSEFFKKDFFKITKDGNSITIPEGSIETWVYDKKMEGLTFRVEKTKKLIGDTSTIIVNNNKENFDNLPTIEEIYNEGKEAYQKVLSIIPKRYN